MAKSRKSSADAQESTPAIAPHPRLATPQEIGDLCADVYRHGIRVARAQGADEESVEQQALDDVRQFMAACIRDSRAEWKTWSSANRVIAVFAETAKRKGKTTTKSKTKTKSSARGKSPARKTTSRK